MGCAIYDDTEERKIAIDEGTFDPGNVSERAMS
jgi:hypothetical protein